MITDEERNYAAIEAIAFAAGHPVEIERIAQTLELDVSYVDKLIEGIRHKYSAPEFGIELIRTGDAVQFATKSDFAADIRLALDYRRTASLSPAAMEVLAIVAYNQPVTRAYIEQVRAVDCSGVISSLMEKELICEQGRLDVPGRPLLFGVTRNFFRCFNISSLAELPPFPTGDPEQLALYDSAVPPREEQGDEAQI